MTERARPVSLLWTAYEQVAKCVGLGALALVCLCWLPPALLLNRVLPRRLGQPAGRRMIKGGFRFYLWILGVFCACRFDLAELDRLRDEGPLLLVANHPSLLDAVMIVSRLPNAVCVMKATLMDNILFGAAARLARYIRNDEPLAMILSAREELRRGAQLVFFPEGSRTTNFPVDTCLPTAALISARSGVPLQTLLIEFSSPYLGKEWPLFRKPELPLACRIRVGERFPPPRDVVASTTRLEEYFRHELAPCGVSTVA